MRYFSKIVRTFGSEIYKIHGVSFNPFLLYRKDKRVLCTDGKNVICASNFQRQNNFGDIQVKGNCI